MLGGEAPRRELDKDTKPGLAWPGGREDEDNRNSHLCHADRAASFVLPLGGRPADGSPAIRWSSAETNLHRPESSAQCAHDASRHKSIDLETRIKGVRETNTRANPSLLFMDTAPLTCYNYNRKTTTDMRKTASEALISQTSAWEYVVQGSGEPSHLALQL